MQCVDGNVIMPGYKGNKVPRGRMRRCLDARWQRTNMGDNASTSNSMKTKVKVQCAYLDVLMRVWTKYLVNYVSKIEQKMLMRQYIKQMACMCKA